MPVVLVHGVPDTAAMWEPLVGELARDDVHPLRLPGFAAAVPEGFSATKDEYAAWVADRVAEIGEPVDLVGHDWGSLLTQRVALTRPELCRSFVMIDAAVTDAFTWHDLATQWQTPDVGEQIMELMTGEPVAAALREAGHPDPEGAAARVDDTMKSSVLALYRSAIDVAREWAPRGPSERPGLVVWGRDDPYGAPASGERFAAITGARFVLLDGGHWAALQRPGATAPMLEEFWSGGA